MMLKILIGKLKNKETEEAYDMIDNLDKKELQKLTREEYKVLSGLKNSQDEIVNEAAIILEMWSCLDYSYQRLSENSFKKLDEANISEHDITFIGFHEPTERSCQIKTRF